jgi:hypothetical protein
LRSSFGDHCLPALPALSADRQPTGRDFGFLVLSIKILDLIFLFHFLPLFYYLILHFSRTSWKGIEVPPFIAYFFKTSPFHHAS